MDAACLRVSQSACDICGTLAFIMCATMTFDYSLVAVAAAITLQNPLAAACLQVVVAQMAAG